MTAVTVAIPFGNNVRTLTGAIASVFAQTLEDWRLILIDDGSTDGSTGLARAVDDPRVELISDGRHLGLPARLNQVAAVAHTTWLVRMDADDVMHPARLATQLRAAEQHGADILASPAFSIDDQNRVYGMQSAQPLTDEELLKNTAIVHPTVFGRREWFRTFPYDETFPRSQDKELWLRAAAGTTFAKTTEPLLFYRDAGNFVMSRYHHTRKCDRRILRRYAPARVGRSRASVMVAASYGKEVAYLLATRIHAQDLLMRRSSEKLSAEDRATAQSTLDAVLATSVPGLPTAPVSSHLWSERK